VKQAEPRVTPVRVIWDRHQPDLPPLRWADENRFIRSVRFTSLHVGPEPQYPTGRKGLVLASAWANLGRKQQASGMLILDGDVAIDPEMTAVMLNVIFEAPDVVHTAPVKIWPASTGRQSWVWSHWEKEASQESDPRPRYFSFCFTYLPAALIEACVKAGLEGWQYPNVDASVSDHARRGKFEARAVPGIEPVHLNW
jgi:hypothetical protein